MHYDFKKFGELFILKPENDSAVSLGDHFSHLKNKI